MRTKVSPFGRFFVDWPMRKKDASFFTDQNSNEAWEFEAASKGRISFLLLNAIAFGRFKAIYV
jgi:hypothetical protein